MIEKENNYFYKFLVILKIYIKKGGVIGEPWFPIEKKLKKKKKKRKKI